MRQPPVHFPLLKIHIHFDKFIYEVMRYFLLLKISEWTSKCDKTKNRVDVLLKIVKNVFTSV